MEAVLEEFTGWLAHQDIPPQRRRQNRDCVQDYLRWQAVRPAPHSAPPTPFPPAADEPLATASIPPVIEKPTWHYT
jgi:hypothetical protein